MSVNWWRRLVQLTSRASRYQVQPRKLSRRLELETLEARTVPAINWVNRATATDTFTAAERAVVDQAVQWWNDLITSPQDLNVTITGGSTSGLVLPGNVLGSTSITNYYAGSGRPADARVQITSRPPANPGGWYIDPTPQDNAEFTDIVTRFRATGSVNGVRGVDMFSVTLHELGHALGFTTGGAKFSRNVTADPPPATTRTYTGAGGLTATLVPAAQGTHLDENAHPNDLMNPDEDAEQVGFRTLPSDLDVRILADAYGYTATRPSTHPVSHTFLVNLNTSTGKLAINGDPKVNAGTPRAGSDTIALQRGALFTFVTVDDVDNFVDASLITSVEMDGAAGDDTFNIRNTAGVPVVAYGSDGDDTFNLGSSSNTIDKIDGLEVHGDAGDNTLNILANGSSADATQLLTGASYGFFGPSPRTVVRYEDIKNLTLSTGSGRDTIVVGNTPSGTTTINAGSGNDQILVNGAGGPLKLNGQGGDDLFSFRNFTRTAAVDGGPGSDTIEAAQGTLSLSQVNAPLALLTDVEILQIDGGTLVVDTDVSARSLLVVIGTADLRARTLKLQGGQTGGVQIQAQGVLTGTGTINGDVSNAGQVRPGGDGAVGKFTIHGDYNQTATGRLNIDLQGRAAGSGSDNLDVSRRVRLAGTLAVNTLDGFDGDLFEIITDRATAPVINTFTGLAEGDIVEAGGRRFNITYQGGDGNDVVLRLVPRLTSATTINSPVNPSAFGQAVTFTATVTAASGPGVPTGTVAFLDGTTSLGTGTLDANGVATFTTSTLAVSSHTITAVYQGDGTFSGSTSASLTQVVNPAGTVITLAADSPTSVFGEPITFTAVVGPLAPGAGTPTGTVAFKRLSPDGTILVTFGTAPLDASGTAVFVMANFVPATTTLFAVYLGDGDFSPSTSPTITHIITKADTTLALSSGTPVSVAGQPVTIASTLGVVPPGAFVFTPTGTITYYDTFRGITTVLATSGVGGAAQTPVFTAAGTHVITAVYSGDSTFNGSTAVPITQIVLPGAATHLLIVPAQSTVFPGVPFAMTVTALDAYNNIATSYDGTVHFTSSDPLAMIPPDGTFTAADGGARTFSGFTLLSPGDQTITVTDTLTLTITGTIVFHFVSGGGP